MSDFIINTWSNKFTHVVKGLQANLISQEVCYLQKHDHVYALYLGNKCMHLIFYFYFLPNIVPHISGQLKE